MCAPSCTFSWTYSQRTNSSLFERTHHEENPHTLHSIAHSFGSGCIDVSAGSTGYEPKSSLQWVIKLGQMQLSGDTSRREHSDVSCLNNKRCVPEQVTSDFLALANMLARGDPMRIPGYSEQEVTSFSAEHRGQRVQSEKPHNSQKVQDELCAVEQTARLAMFHENQQF